MTIHIHVERVVLDGLDLDAGAAQALGSAVGDELARLFVECGDTADLGSVGALALLRTSPVHFAHGSSPERMGSQVAGAVFGSVAR